MKESIGGVAVFNIMIVFIITVFALLWAAYSYANAYKINTRIMNGIEISEGYNDTAVRYINTAMQAMGYRRGRKDCPATWELNGKTGSLVQNDNSNYYYCIYYFDSETEKNGLYGGCYYSYGVVTYIGTTLPFGARFELPIVSKTNAIYNFDSPGSQTAIANKSTAAVSVCK